MYARRTRSIFRARMSSSNSARMHKSNITTERIVYGTHDSVSKLLLNQWHHVHVLVSERKQLNYKL